MQPSAVATRRPVLPVRQREKTHHFPAVRVTKSQRDILEKKARQYRVSYAGLIVAAVLNLSLPPMTSIDRKQLALLLAGLGRLNGNINQIAKAANYGNAPLFHEVIDEMREIAALRPQLLALLGQPPR